MKYALPLLYSITSGVRVWRYISLAVVILPLGSAFAQAGSLDPSFGNGGIVTTDIVEDDRGYGMAIDATGRIVVCGRTLDGNGSDVLVARYSTDGSLDTDFNGTGIVTTDLGGDESGVAVEIDDQQRIVVAVRTDNFGFALVRYMIDGSLDPDFDTGGISLSGNNLPASGPAALTLQPDGKILVVGTRWVSGMLPRSALIRCNADGTMDQGFASLGVCYTTWEVGGFGSDVGVLADGRIMVSGRSIIGDASYHFAAARYMPNGTLDTSFDGDGKVVTDIPTSTNEMSGTLVIRPDGSVIMGGFLTVDGDQDVCLAAYSMNGTPDDTFGVDGLAIAPVAGNSAGAPAMELQANGQILVAGYGGVGLELDATVLRFDPAGILDTSFDTDGMAVFNISGNDQASAVRSQADGKIVVAGSTSDGTNRDVLVMRLLATPSTGMNDLASHTQEIGLSPIPFNDQLRMIMHTDLGEQALIELFDVRGTLMFSRALQASTTGAVIEFDTSDLPPGCYLVRVRDPSHLFHRPVMKTR